MSMRIEMSIAKSSEQSIDFGEIEEGQSKEYDVEIHNTTNYKVVAIKVESAPEMSVSQIPEYIEPRQYAVVKVLLKTPQDITEPIPLFMKVTGKFVVV